jgi:hypothetical protein
MKNSELFQHSLGPWQPSQLLSLWGNTAHYVFMKSQVESNATLTVICILEELWTHIHCSLSTQPLINTLWQGVVCQNTHNLRMFYPPSPPSNGLEKDTVWIRQDLNLPGTGKVFKCCVSWKANDFFSGEKCTCAHEHPNWKNSAMGAYHAKPALKSKSSALWALDRSHIV